MTPGGGDLARLLAVHEINTLKARYFRTLDTKDWTGLEAVFSPEARIGPMESGLPGSALANVADLEPADFVQRARRGLADAVSVHHGHTAEIEIKSATSALGRWAMSDLLRFPSASPVTELRGYGHYDEEYVVHGGEWRIHRMRLSRLRVDLR